MITVDLFAGEPSRPRVAWTVIDAARQAHITGELTLHTAVPVRVYLRDGLVYFAERTTDGSVGVRLLLEGVINRQQLANGTIVVNGVEHLGRMFDRDGTVDRAAVELCLELFTDEVLQTVANEMAESHQVAMYKRHPSGVDRWYPNRTHVVTRVVGSGQDAPEPTTEHAVIQPMVSTAAEAPIAVVAPVAPVGSVSAAGKRSIVNAADPTIVVPLVSTAMHVPPADLFEPVVHEDQEDFTSDLASAVRRALEAIEAAGEPLPIVDAGEFLTGDWVLSKTR